MKGMKWLVLILALIILAGILWLGLKNTYSIQPIATPTPTSTVILPPTIPLSPTVGSNCQAINIVSPKANDTVSSPMKVTVIIDNSKVDCHWTAFEAQAGTLVLKDNMGMILGNGILKTTEDWTSSTPVTYIVTITFTQSNEKNLTLIINEENPSGKPNAQSISIPVIQK